MINKTYNITFSINRPYLLFMCVSLYSLLKNNQQYNFDIYVLHNNCLNQKEINNITNKHPLNQYNNFKIYLVNVSTLKEIANFNHNLKWTKEVYFKLFLPQLLPNIDIILHLDTDIIIREDISNFLETKMQDYLYCADANKNSNICIGVSLWNLKLAREIDSTKKLLNFIEKQKKIHPKDSYHIAEEYAINSVFKDYICYSDVILNLHHLKPFNTQSIIHFVDIKPWNVNRKVNKNYKNVYYEYYIFLKDFNKYPNLIILYGYYVINYGYIINSLLKRIKGFVYKYLLKKQKFEYIHKNLFLSFLKNTSTNIQ